MGIFSAILDKIRHHVSGSDSPASTAQPTAGSTQQAQPSAQAGLQGSPPASMQDVDIEAVLARVAASKGGGGNYRESIVDLLKLLDLDSNLDARKELAEELGVHAGAHGSAEQNIALHKAVMQKVEENGGKVPESMKH